uniref:ribonuclease Z n=1 Tax=Kwoniella dejecticola CBS 10117 TaxID=1296121 RepID=A0A1A5ZUF0_9TREE|nr:uncharacterized protein I303_08200 [Kwoniella dejecticola CBS 10117]OBR81430.1 hypothetical protein I303_08200 [Kwoniella dejecticola CBS 10117]
MAPSNTEAYLPNWQVKCLTAPGPDSDLSLHVSFDNARFLFGCGEGVLMTAADAGISKVDIVGPPDMSHYLSTLRSSVIRDSLTVNMRSYPRSCAPGEAVELFKSPNITVHGIALSPQPIAGPSRPSPQYTSFDPHSADFRPARLSPEDTQKWTDQIIGDIFHNGPKARASRRPPPPGSKSPPRPASPQPANPFVNPDGTICSSIPDTRYPLPLPSLEDAQTQMVYICQASDLRGKFDVNKANALGVPKGPARGKLTRGEAIEVDDINAEGGKRIVKPEDCLVGGGPGAVLIVVNCSENSKSDLLSNPTFQKYQPGAASSVEPAVHVHLMVHRVPRSVWESEEYKDWMTAFGPRTQHLIADPINYPDRTVFNSAAWNTLQLSIADPNIFIPPWVSSPRSPSVMLPPNTSFLVEGTHCRMHPPAPVTMLETHEKDIPFLITKEEGESARETIRQDMPEYSIACDAAQIAVSSALRSGPPSEKQIGDVIVVTTLGTGSAIPSKYRNVSSTHLDIPDLGGILLDAGEGTLGQIRRRFGKEGTKKMFEELSMIFISHMHADHHLGLNSVLEERFKLGIDSPLYIIGPTSIALNLQESASWQYAAPSEDALRNVQFINIQRLNFKVESNFRSTDPVSPSRKTADQAADTSLDGENLHEPLEIREGHRSVLPSPMGNLFENYAPKAEIPRPSRSRSRSRTPPRRAPSAGDPNYSENPVKSKAEAENQGVELDQWESEGLEDRANGRRLWPFTHVYNFTPAATRDHWRLVNTMLNSLGLSSIWAPLVPHRGRAYGLAIEHASGWKVVYSGDTKPSEELVKAGQDATLLIHEATLEDDKPEVAAIKGHSTFSQAIDVGRRMNAKHILLNHFSQRYPKLPKLPVFSPTPVPTVSTDEAGNDTAATHEIPSRPVVSISFDFMSLRIGDMWKMQYYMEPLSLLFVEAEEEGDGEGSVVGAVRKDVNPTLDGNGNVNVNSNGIGKNKKNKTNRAAAETNGKQATNMAEECMNNVDGQEMHNTGQEHGKSKRAMKKERTQALQQDQGKGKRPASPMGNETEREVKRRSTDSSVGMGGEEGMQVDVDVA